MEDPRVHVGEPSGNDGGGQGHDPIQDPQDKATPKCDGHCLCEAVEILRRSPTNHVVGMDWVIKQIKKFEEDLYVTINDGTKFFRTVGEICNGVAKCNGEVTRLGQHQQGIIDGLMEAMEALKKTGQVQGCGMTRLSSTPKQEPEQEPDPQGDHAECRPSQGQPGSHR